MEFPPNDPKNSLAATFNQTAVDAGKAFPDRLHNLVMLLTSAETPVYIDPAVANHLTHNVAAVKLLVKSEKNYLLDNSAAAVVTHDYPLAGVFVNLITLNETVRGIFSDGYTQEMQSSFYLDHELGHLVVKNGMLAGGHLGECAADAYAALRHVQRFGKETDLFQNYNRAYTIVLGFSRIHYTDHVTQKVKQLAQETDITGLSLTETAALAGDIALAHQLDLAVLDKITAAYRPVAAACERQIGSRKDIVAALYQQDNAAWEMMCRETLAVMKAHQNDADIFASGKHFLSYQPRLDFIAGLAKTDPEWQAALEFISPPAQKIPAQKISPQKKAGGFQKAL
jgi:hypothetical protein